MNRILFLPLPIPRLRDKPTPAPRKNVKSMIESYEQNIISPPPHPHPQFRDKPTPAPRTKKEKPTPAPRTKKEKPTPAPRTKIKQLDQALKGYTKSYEISIKNDKDPLLQLQNTRIGSSISYLKYTNIYEWTKIC